MANNSTNKLPWANPWVVPVSWVNTLMTWVKTWMAEYIKPYWHQDCFEWWWWYHEMLEKWELFDYEKTSCLWLRELIRLYGGEIDSYESSSQSLIRNLNKDIVNLNGGVGLSEKNIIPICLYIYENQTDELFLALKKIDIPCKIVIYVNWYINQQNYKDDLELLLKNKMIELQKLSQKHLKSSSDLIVVWNIYDERKSMWTIHWDLLDSIVLSLADDGKDRIIYPLDADITDFSDWYFSYIEKMFSEEWTRGNLAWLVAQRRWSSTSDKNDFLRFNELLFLIWEDNTHARSNNPYWLAWTTWIVASYKLSDLLRVKWYSRKIRIWEDLVLWHKLNCYYWNWKGKDMSVLKNINTKIYSSPRRWHEALSRWKPLFQQYDDPDFKFIDSNSEFQNTQLFSIFEKLVNDGELTALEIKTITEWINSYISFFSCWIRYDLTKKLPIRIMRIWNLHYAAHSKYRMEIIGRFINFKIN
ncbi:MAG: hypothetical protein ACD_3C00100G0009 [uncultured bacterium (gcode 4)]|uniref:Uncharacterized protein n=1 Tax=uncultured bacterium (gcode 4) TaxID=1234023 RepID=K2GD09_9BACT|nr:MAG: hypothetical protein ACD_3C00100G0009 [uncultured bacterium (gcode 4)]